MSYDNDKHKFLDDKETAEHRRTCCRCAIAHALTAFGADHQSAMGKQPPLAHLIEGMITCLAGLIISSTDNKDTQRPLAVSAAFLLLSNRLQEMEAMQDAQKFMDEFEQAIKDGVTTIKTEGKSLDQIMEEVGEVVRNRLSKERNHEQDLQGEAKFDPNTLHNLKPKGNA